MLNYNDRLKPQQSKGKCGDPEYLDSESSLQIKVDSLVETIRCSKYIVVLTGAGISTAAGIPDFRGRNGVWTKELRGIQMNPSECTTAIFDDAKPTFSHYALFHLLKNGWVKHIVSQNVDGLHLRSGVPPEALSEVHGNIFMEICENCGRKYFRDHDVGGMGLRYTGNICEASSCNGKLRDFAIDWDTELPEDIMDRARKEFKQSDLVLCLGTSLRIRPLGNMPCLAMKGSSKLKKRKGKLVIVNLQETHLDGKAYLKIHHYCDEVLRRICKKLGVPVTTGSIDDSCPDYFQDYSDIK